MSVALESGCSLIWVPENPPSYAATRCRCSRHCPSLLWSNGIAVETRKGLLTVSCGLRKNLLTSKELDKVFPHLLEEREPPRDRLAEGAWENAPSHLWQKLAQMNLIRVCPKKRISNGDET